MSLYILFPQFLNFLHFHYTLLPSEWAYQSNPVLVYIWHVALLYHSNHNYNAVQCMHAICTVCKCSRFRARNLLMHGPPSKPITPFYGLLPFHYSCGKKTLLLNSAKLMNSLKKLTTIYREKHDQSEEFDVNHWATIVRYCRCPRATYHAVLV